MIRVNGVTPAMIRCKGRNLKSIRFRGAKIWEHNHAWNDGTCSTCGKVCSHAWNDGMCIVCYKMCNHPTTDLNGTCTTCGQATSVVFLAKRYSLEDTYNASYPDAKNAAYIAIPGLPIGLYLSKQYAKRSTISQWNAADKVILEPILPGEYYLYYFTYSNGNNAPYLMTLTQNGSKIIDRSTILMNDVYSCYPVKVTIPAGRRTTLICDFEIVETSTGG